MGHAQAAHAPAWFSTAPSLAIQKLFETVNWQKDDVDLFEINEAFAQVARTAIHDLQLEHQKVNINGVAFALGHSIGASGARILITLIHALAKGKKGIAALCIGG